jgi:hypothetical protein
VCVLLIRVVLESNSASLDRGRLGGVRTVATPSLETQRVTELPPTQRSSGNCKNATMMGTTAPYQSGLVRSTCFWGPPGRRCDARIGP